MTNVVPYHPDHFVMVDGRECDDPFKYLAEAQGYLDHGVVGFTVMENNAVIGCMGIIKTGIGEGEPWVHISERMAKKYPVLLTKLAKLAIREAQYRGVKRLFTAIRADRNVNRQWAERLGFEPLEIRMTRGEVCMAYMKHLNGEELCLS